MVKLKNYNVVLKQIGFILTFFILFSCAEKKLSISRIDAKKISVSDSIAEKTEIEDFIKPYRIHIDKDLSLVLANAPKTLDKSGIWQTPIGNFLSDLTLDAAVPLFKTRENKTVSICLLNHGGIRSIIPAGEITARTAYEVMPFENTAFVVGLKGEQLLEMAHYLIAEKKPHPLSGMTFTIDANNQPKDILVSGQPFNISQTYYVVTSDYLINGGDNMLFFKKSVATYDLNYKLRNIIIDYFKSHSLIEASTSIRIKKEN
jgi:2',3'-cyclic-nucleotide 2'-phosphodiesterase (5'-nucleotidase family)